MDMEKQIDILMNGELKVERTYLSTIDCGSRDCNSSAWAIW